MCRNPAQHMTPFATLLLQEQPKINQELLSLTQALPEYVRPAAIYALEAGGKRMRPLLAVLCARTLGYRGDEVYRVGCAVEFLHAATLLHDDVLDNATVRRGKPCAHHTFGLAPALLAADAMFARGCTIVAAFDNPHLVACLSEAIVQTTNGEIMEIAHQGRIQTDLSTYSSIIAGKTAWLLRTSCELGARMASSDETVIKAAADFGHNLGMAFQIADDALDFAPSGKTGKPEGGDVREGKFTPPILFYMQSLDTNQQHAFVEQFSSLAFTDNEIVAIVQAVREGGFQEKALRLADSYLHTAAEALHCLPAMDEAAREAHTLLAAGLNFVRNRSA